MNEVIKSQFQLLQMINCIINETNDAKTELESVIINENTPLDI